MMKTNEKPVVFILKTAGMIFSVWDQAFLTFGPLGVSSMM